MNCLQLHVVAPRRTIGLNLRGFTQLHLAHVTPTFGQRSENSLAYFWLSSSNTLQGKNVEATKCQSVLANAEPNKGMKHLARHPSPFEADG